MSKHIYLMKKDDDSAGVLEGDLVVCGPMHWAWASEKVAGLWRLGDGKRVGVSFYRSRIEYVEAYDEAKHGKEPSNDQ